MKPIRWTGQRRGLVAALAAVALAFGAAGAALADDCNGDIAKLTQKRQGVIDQLNKIAKGKQLDPIASCPKLRELVAAERELLGYMTKNKDWCMVPDDALANLTASVKKSTGFAGQACNAAAQVRKMQQQQAAGIGGAPAQKLPAGPL